MNVVRARSRAPALALGFIALLAPFVDSVSGQTRLVQPQQLALVGGTIYVSPTEDAIRDGVVLIEDGRIAAVGRRGSLQIPRGVEVLDCSGLTVAAGFWNSHVHFQERKWSDASRIPAPELGAQLQAMLTRYGFTSVFDTGSMWENTRWIRDRVESGEVPGPHIRSTGEILFPKGGPPPDMVFDITGAMRVKLPEVADAPEALAESRKLLDAGVDGNKVYAATWAPPIVALPESAIRAAANEAHRRGKPLLAHPSNRAGLLSAARGGADIVVHTSPQSGPWDEEILTAMKKSGVALIPTLKLWRYELRHDRDSVRERFVGLGVGQLRAWLASGGAVLFGTDVGYMNDYDPSDEYALMAEAGMSARQILASLTTTPAGQFGESTRLGRISPRLAADLVVLGEDPSANARAFAAVRYTIRGGTVIYRSAK